MLFLCPYLFNLVNIVEIRFISNSPFNWANYIQNLIFHPEYSTLPYRNNCVPNCPLTDQFGQKCRANLRFLCWGGCRLMMNHPIPLTFSLIILAWSTCICTVLLLHYTNNKMLK